MTVRPDEQVPKQHVDRRMRKRPSGGVGELAYCSILKKIQELFFPIVETVPIIEPGVLTGFSSIGIIYPLGESYSVPSGASSCSLWM